MSARRTIPKCWAPVLLALVLSCCSLLQAPPAQAVIAVGAGTVENSSSAVVYSGTWGSSSSSQDSAGSVSTLAVTGYAEITFQETSVQVVARTASYYGIADVYLDGTKVAAVDQYSPATTFKTVAYRSPTLPYGTHTLRIERSGTKNDASSGRTVNLDSFVVADSRPPATPAGLSAAAAGAGAALSWSASTDADLAGYLVYRSSGASGTYTRITPSPVKDVSFGDPALTPGATYRYQVSAVDTSGNESVRTGDATVVANDTRVGPGTVDNSAADITYSGPWTTSTSSSDSGGSVAALADTGWAQLGFRGTGVKVVARTASYYGIANVYVDDRLVTTVDLYSSTTASATVVHATPVLPYGVHTIRIERSGTKNAASSGRSVNLDALVVVDAQPPPTPTGLKAVADGTGARLSWDPSTDGDLAGYVVQRATGTSAAYTTSTQQPVPGTGFVDPALTPGTTYRYRVAAVDTSGNQSPLSDDVPVTAAGSVTGPGTVDSADGAIVYSGTWSQSASSLDSGGSVATLASTGFAQVAFRETSIRLVARTGSYYGIANVYLDGTLVAAVDQYSPSTAYRKVLYSSPVLPYGVHTLRVERSGSKNDASSGRTVNLDAFLVLDTRAPATPSGLAAAAEGGGARLTWTGGSEPDLAGYRVHRSTGTSSTWTTVTAQPVTGTTYLDPGLEPDTVYHYRISAVDTSGNESSRSADVSLTSTVSVAEAGTVEDTSDTLAFAGPWTAVTSASDSGGSSRRLAEPGFVQISFRETSIKVVARTANFLGIANVYLDGVLVGTMDQYSSVTSYKSVTYSSPTLDYRTHTLRIERTGTKNDASSGRAINVDSFVVPDTQAPAVPTRLSAVPEGAGARLTWAGGTEADLSGYLVYRATGDEADFRPVTGGPVNGTSYLDPDLAPDTRYRYRVTAIDGSRNESSPAVVALRSAVAAGTYPALGTSVVLAGTWSADVDPTTQQDQGPTTTGPASASLTFNEDGVRWIGSTGPSGGIARVFVDATLAATVDQYSADVRRDVTLFETSGLGAGAHTVRVTWTRDRSAGDGPVTTSVKAFVVPDTAPPEVPRSVWALPVGNGIDLEWNPPGDDVAGYLVYRAKGSETTFVPLTSTPLHDTSYLDADLVPGTSYRYEVTAVDTSGNESKRSYVASATTALSTGTVENTSPAVVYSTTWSTFSSTRDSGGSYSMLGAPGDARLTFSGTGVKWVTRTNNFSGIGQVYVDGAPVARVDLYSAVQQYQQVVWSTSSLTDGTHTIRIERTGTMNAASTGRNLTLDAFVVTDSTAPPPMPDPVVTNTRLGTKVSWSASSAADVAAYKLLRTGPDGTEILVDRLPPSQLSFLDVGLAAGTSYRFRLTAVDSSGNESRPGTGVVTTTPPAPPPVPGRYAACPAATRTVSSASTLQTALRDARPGDVIVLAPGTYTGSFPVSVVGTERNPVWICGPRSAVIDYKDIASGIGFRLTGASWVNLTGMTIQNVQKGVVVTGGSHVTISDVHFTTIGQEAVHLRSFTVDSTVVGNLIERTGLHVPQYGEGVYVGSDPDAWCAYSSCSADRSDRNAVLDNTISGVTAEAVDAKAGTSDGTVSGNVVDGALMTSSTADGLIVIKGTSWLVSGNTGANAPQNGFTATYSKAEGWGGGNVFVANRAAVGNDTGYGVWLQRGIGNIAGCDNTTTSGVRVTNLTCQR